MTAAPTFITAAAAARILDMDPRAFARNLARLTDEAGFPPPLPWDARRWRRADVEAWAAGVYVAPELGRRERACAARKAVMRHMARAS